MSGFIALKNLQFGYTKQKKVIRGISLEFSRQDFTFIIGPNGSGKTTLGKLIMGILKPQNGRILIDNIDNKSMSLGTVGKQVGYLFQNPERQIFASKVWDELAFPLELKGFDRQTINNTVGKALETFQLTNLAQSFPFTLSQGEKQRLALASILINEPKFLILDEPTTGLDLERKKILSHILNKLNFDGIGIIAISHDEDFIEKHATRIIEMVGGEVVGDKKNIPGSKV